MEVICQYCNNPTELVGGERIYPHLKYLHSKKYWLCAKCDAYVGTHKGSNTNAPLGILANSELRRAKLKAHEAFDPMWKYKSWTRNKAYKWLASQLNIPKKTCHIGEFDIETCNKVVEICHRRI